jgi:hypothetical protein
MTALASRAVLASCLAFVVSVPLRADPPVASYIFPAGGQRGTAVPVRVGGLNLHSRCGFELHGPGVEAGQSLKSMRTIWFEGPILPLPESQQQEDYPKDMAGTIRIAADAVPGPRVGRLWTAQGAASGLAFVVGELPEVVEDENRGDRSTTKVTLPVTINGRIFPREEVDEWTFSVIKGQTIVATVLAGRLGFPLVPRLEIVDQAGRRLAENDPYPGAADARITFTAPGDGEYRIRIFDARFLGGQNYIYRLTLAADHPASDPDTPRSDKPLEIPAAVRGHLSVAGQVDGWNVALKKGTAYEFDIHARRLDSPLRAVLTLRDATGKELAKVDGIATNSDPIIHFTAPADGVYRVEVAERFQNRGGPAFVYLLKVERAIKPSADFRLTIAADALTIPRGGQAKLKVAAERFGGFAGPIDLAIEGLGGGVSIGKATLAANQSAIEIPISASAGAAIRRLHLKVKGSAKIGEAPVSHFAHIVAGPRLPEVDSILAMVALPTPFVVKADYLLSQAPRGTVFSRHYRIERNGFAGPITVTLADRQARHLQGVTGPTIVVPPEKSEFDYAITMPPWMETGRTCRACVMAVGEVKDAGGGVHEVGFSSVEQNMQIIVVVEPGRLGLELERGSLRAERGGEVVLPLRVQRGEGLAGPATVELLSIPGVRCETVTIAANQSAGVLRLHFDKIAQLKPTTAVVRATVQDTGRPIVAEAKVEIVPGD